MDKNFAFENILNKSQITGNLPRKNGIPLERSNIQKTRKNKKTMTKHKILFM